jgi:biofilm protein TabA
MIVGTLETVQSQIAQTPNIQAALAYLRNFDPGTVEDGRYTVSKDTVFAIIESYDTESCGETVQIEGHRKFIDIYWLLSGSERVGWMPVNRLSATPAYDAQKDAWTEVVSASDLSYVTLERGDAAVLFPEDVHMAQMAVNSPMPARKVIMKVAVD